MADKKHSLNILDFFCLKTKIPAILETQILQVMQTMSFLMQFLAQVSGMVSTYERGTEGWNVVSFFRPSVIAEHCLAGEPFWISSSLYLSLLICYYNYIPGVYKWNGCVNYYLISSLSNWLPIMPEYIEWPLSTTICSMNHWRFSLMQIVNQTSARAFVNDVITS